MALPPEEWERRRALYLEEITFEAGFWRDVAIHASEGAVEFAKEGIIAIYLLNGGGIGVIATAAGSLGLKGPDAVSLAIPFFVGLLAALLCNLVAYANQIALHTAFDSDYWKEYNSAHRLYFPEDQDLDAIDKTITKLTSKGDRARRWSDRLRYTAIGLAVIGLAAFAIGGVRFICATT